MHANKNKNHHIYLTLKNHKAQTSTVQQTSNEDTRINMGIAFFEFLDQ